METSCSSDANVEEQVPLLLKIVILTGVMMVAVYILLKEQFKTCDSISVEERTKERGILVTGREPSLPVEQESTDNGELVSSC